MGRLSVNYGHGRSGNLCGSQASQAHSLAHSLLQLRSLEAFVAFRVGAHARDVQSLCLENTFGPQYLRNGHAGFVEHLCYLRLLRDHVQTESETIIVTGQSLNPLAEPSLQTTSSMSFALGAGARSHALPDFCPKCVDR